MGKTKEERRKETAAMAKCECGNVARLGHKTCGRCAEEEERCQRGADNSATARTYIARLENDNPCGNELLRDAIVFLLERYVETKES